MLDNLFFKYMGIFKEKNPRKPCVRGTLQILGARNKFNEEKDNS